MDIGQFLSDTLATGPIQYGDYLLKVIGAQGYLAGISFLGTQVALFHVGLFWLLQNFFPAKLPVKGDKYDVLISVISPFLISLPCYLLALIGGYIQGTPDLLFGAIQIALIVGAGAAGIGAVKDKIQTNKDNKALATALATATTPPPTIPYPLADASLVPPLGASGYVPMSTYRVADATAAAMPVQIPLTPPATVAAPTPQWSMDLMKSEGQQ